MAPIHANEVDRAGNGECREIPANLTEKGGEFGTIHFARSHRERTMVDRAEAAGMSVDRHVVGRVSKDHRGTFFAH